MSSSQNSKVRRLAAAQVAAAVKMTRDAILKSKPTKDSYYNAVAGLGFGNSPLSDSQTYTATYLSHNRQLLENMYCSSFICQRAVDTFSDDATRKGINILSSKLKPEQIAEIHKKWVELNIWARLNQTFKWSRLYGGCLAVVLIDGQDMEKELDLSKPLEKGQFKGITVLDRWQCQPSVDNIVKEFGPHFMRPMYYKVTNTANPLFNKNIHHSRAIQLDGMDVPFFRKQAENGWGISVFERIYERLTSFDSTTLGAAQLAYRAYLRTMKIEGLREIVATGNEALAGLQAQMQFMRATQSSEGVTVLDSTDEFETHTYTFAGLDNILDQMAVQVAGAVGVPVTRLFGSSAKGLNATGEGDLKNYHEDVAQQQTDKLTNGISLLINLTCKSELGMDMPDDLTFTFRSLDELTEDVKSTISEKNTKAVRLAYDGGIVGLEEARAELRESSKVTGLWTNVDEKTPNDIKQAPAAPGEGEFGLGKEEGYKR